MISAEIAEPAALINDEMNGLCPSLTSLSVPANMAIKRAKALSAFRPQLIIGAHVLK